MRVSTKSQWLRIEIIVKLNALTQSQSEIERLIALIDTAHTSNDVSVKRAVAEEVRRLAKTEGFADNVLRKINEFYNQ